MKGKAATTTNSEVSCWICLDEGEDDHGNHLTRNCACRGDSGWVHVSCISNFAKVSACDFIVIGNDGLQRDNSIIDLALQIYILYKNYYVAFLLIMNILKKHFTYVLIYIFHFLVFLFAVMTMAPRSSCTIFQHICIITR